MAGGAGALLRRHDERRGGSFYARENGARAHCSRQGSRRMKRHGPPLRGGPGQEDNDEQLTKYPAPAAGATSITSSSSSAIVLPLPSSHQREHVGGRARGHADHDDSDA